MLESLQPAALFNKVTSVQNSQAIGMRINNYAVFQASLEGVSGSVSATIQLYGSNDPVVDTNPLYAASNLLGTFTLTNTANGLGFSVAQQVISVQQPYRKFWAGISSISGIGTAVSLWAAV